MIHKTWFPFKFKEDKKTSVIILLLILAPCVSQVMNKPHYNSFSFQRNIIFKQNIIVVHEQREPDGVMLNQEIWKIPTNSSKVLTACHQRYKYMFCIGEV